MSARAASPPVTVYLVDASPYIFRAHFSLPDSLKSPAGARVGAVYGFAGFLLGCSGEQGGTQKVPDKATSKKIGEEMKKSQLQYKAARQQAAKEKRGGGP